MISRAIGTRLLERMDGGTLVIDGVEHGRGGDLRAEITLHDPARFWRGMIFGGEGAGRAYMDGCWDTDDLVSLVSLGARNMPAFDRLREHLGPALGPIQRMLWRLKSNTPARTRRRIASHYDLGNDFFSLWLDPTLSYSSGIFDTPDGSLERAQEAKVDRALAHLKLTPDHHLLEIGTGWGYLAARAAKEYGCRVTTTTVSAEQHAFAAELIRREGLEDRVTLLLEDYRDLTGRYDRIVSIEMIEAVGWEYLDGFVEQCCSLLEQDGAMLIQAITFADDVFEVEKASKGFINEFIFPGGTLLSLEAIGRSMARHSDLRHVALDDITPHYSETLRRWRTAFNAAESELDRLGYDKRFRRMWDLYLAYCEAGFTERRIRDVQALYAKPGFEARLPVLEPVPALEAVA